MFQLARGLARRGHRVAIVSRPGGDVPGEARREGLDFLPLSLKHEFDFGSARRLARISEDREVDVVHVHKGIAHSVALFATAFSRRRLVLVVAREDGGEIEPGLAGGEEAAADPAAYLDQ